MSNPEVNSGYTNPNLPLQPEHTIPKQEVTSFGIFSQSRILTIDNKKDSGIRAYTAPLLGITLKLFNIAIKVTLPPQKDLENRKKRTFYVNKKSLLHYVDVVESLAKGLNPSEKAHNIELQHPEIQLNKAIIDVLKTENCIERRKQLEKSIEDASKICRNDEFFKEIYTNLAEIYDLDPSPRQYNEIRSLSAIITEYSTSYGLIAANYLSARDEYKRQVIQDKILLRSNEIMKEVGACKNKVNKWKKIMKYECASNRKVAIAFQSFENASQEFTREDPIDTQESKLLTIRNAFKEIEMLEKMPAQELVSERIKAYRENIIQFSQSENTEVLLMIELFNDLVEKYTLQSAYEKQIRLLYGIKQAYESIEKILNSQS